MLTTVILDGAMGKKFGRKWELSVNSPGEALRLINANVEGLRGWMVDRAKKYSAYRVFCEYEDGTKGELPESGLSIVRKIKSIRFTPVIEGAGAGVRIVIGVALMVGSLWMGPVWGPISFSAGMSLAIGGVVSLLTNQPAAERKDTEDRLSSHYFNGPANTTNQGNPVQLIYGRCLVGSQVVSARLDIDEMTTFS